MFKCLLFVSEWMKVCWEKHKAKDVMNMEDVIRNELTTSPLVMSTIVFTTCEANDCNTSSCITQCTEHTPALWSLASYCPQYWVTQANIIELKWGFSRKSTISTILFSHIIQIDNIYLTSYCCCVKTTSWIRSYYYCQLSKKINFKIRSG